MRKRVFSLMLAATMVGMTLAGCSTAGKPQDSDSASKTLDVWLAPLDDDTKNNWDSLLTEWEEEHDCDVNITVIPWDKYQETYTTAMSSGEIPDVDYIYNEMFPTFIEAGAEVDMSEYITDEDRAEYKYLDNGNIMGGQYGWPIVTGVPFILYYNVDILNELGEEPPETWDDFVRICQKATQDTDGDGQIDQYGYAVGMNTSDIGPVQILNAYYYSVLWQNGSNIYNDDLKSVAFANEAGVEAMTWMKDLTQYMNPDFMSYSWSEAFSTIFGTGKAAFGVNRSSQTDETTYAEAYPDLNWDYVTSLKNVDYGTFGATDSLTLMSAAEDKDLAMDFIKYVTSAEFMEQYHAKCPGAALTETESYVGDPKMERIYTEDKDKWHGIQVGPCSSDILTQLAADLQGIMTGELTVEEGLAEAEEYSNNLLNEYWAEQG